MKKLLLSGLLSLYAVCSVGQNILKTMLRLPDTGQSGDYTNTFGEDADYVLNPPFYVKNGNGTATDTVTGLMWQQTDGGEMTLENALAYCDTLSLGGYIDWRLPDAHEGFSILNHQFNNPALDGAVFTVTGAEYWWTSTRQANDVNKIWVTNAGGGIGNHPKTETVSAGGNKKFHVRAVRALQSPGMVPDHFTDNGDGSITDHLTGLIWQQVPFQDSLNWEQALQYAEMLSLAGQIDWRLPNIKELQSINEESRINPSVDPAIFSNIGVKKYWSSTSLPNQTTKAWYLDTRFGITTYAFKTQKCNLICVRGPESGATGIHDVVLSGSSLEAFPNPFSNHIFLKSQDENTRAALFNSFGQLIFEGENIEYQDFSHLPKGVFFLKANGRDTVPVRLIKI